MQNLLSSKDLGKDDILDIIKTAEMYHDLAAGKGSSKELEGKILAALFYEPSTRTRLSTETAMVRLGGQVITAVGEEFSSLKKGETLYDTGKVVSKFADVIAVRHKQAGSAAELAKGAEVPLINCGDGPADHPTQALLDAYTIYKQYGRLDNLKICFAGDLKFSRTAHGLIQLLSNFEGNEVRLVSPESLSLGSEYKVDGNEYVEVDDLAEAVKEVDVVYSIRVQKERFKDQSEYERLKAVYVFDKAFLEENCPESILMHPLPRIDEITKDADEFKGSVYFDMVTNGVAVRMALLTKLLCS